MQRKGIPRSTSNSSYFRGGNGSLLPMTESDGRKTVPGSSRIMRHMNGMGSSMMSNTNYVKDGAIGSISVSTVGKVIAIFTIVIVTGMIVKNVVWGSPATEDLFEDTKLSSSQKKLVDSTGANNPGGGLRNNYWQTLDEQKLPLSEYPSIQYALDHSDIVLLYFAASWCKMSTPITELLDEKFGDILLPPPSSGQKLTGRQRRPISLVYVSSDETEQQMIQYTRKNWIDVPFPSEERTNLKKHFKVAAKREMEALDIQRMYEIPTIIIVSGESHNVVTTHGVDDLKEKGSEALIHWIKLLHINKALEDKYY